MVTIREALFEDAVHIAYNMRDEDRKELQASGGDPVDLLLDGWEKSDWCKVALVDGLPSVIWGVSPCDEETGSPWLLATDAIVKIKKTFLMNCRPDVDRMQQQYKRLFNYVHINNKIAQQWLVWLGFDLHKEPTGENKDFYLFTKGVFNV
jgi:hypothetical protein